MILLLETSTLNCSVALGQPDGTHIKTREVSDGGQLAGQRRGTLDAGRPSRTRAAPGGWPPPVWARAPAA